MRISLTDYLGTRRAPTLVLAAALLVAFACESSKAPPPPEASGAKTGGSDDDDDDDKDRDDDEDEDEDIGVDDDDSSDDDTDTGTSSGQTTFNFGGADVGDQEAKDAVKACHDTKKFYDRFKDAVGACTEHSLALVDCTKEGLLAILSDGNKAKFNEALDSKYPGFKIDQCLDCPPNNSISSCVDSKDARQTGTKVFLVEDVNSEIHGRSMVLPNRPGQDDTATSTGD